jgi:hypothetical protein
MGTISSASNSCDTNREEGFFIRWDGSIAVPHWLELGKFEGLFVGVGDRSLSPLIHHLNLGRGKLTVAFSSVA